MYPRSEIKPEEVHVLSYARRRHDGHLLVLANFSKQPQSVRGDLPFHADITGSPADLLAPTDIFSGNDRIHLGPYGLRWLVREGSI
jgi:hypothetical protein